MFPPQSRVPLIPQESFNLCLVCSGEAEGKEKGEIAKSSVFQLVAGRHPGHAGSWQKVMGGLSLPPSDFNLPSGGPHGYWKSPRGLPDLKRKTPPGELTLGPFPALFSWLSVVLSASAWQGQMGLFAFWKKLADPWMPARNEHCSAPSWPSQRLSPSSAGGAMFIPGTASTMWTICSWPFPALCFHKELSQMFVGVFLFVYC